MFTQSVIEYTSRCAAKSGKHLGHGGLLNNKLVDEEADTIPSDEKGRAFENEASEFVEAFGNK